ncbi:MAG TPA: thermonuclease family protein [Candidatus Onthovivens sp.]|nr:thermonuclease family protein [Candidatus Onthovivens sp.]
MNFKKIRTIVGIIVASVVLPLLASCTPTEPAFIDFVKEGYEGNKVSLKLDYQNREFFKDGIAKVNLRSAIDGDTAHFTQSGGGEIIKSRFYGVDTPESTGLIQEYGKAASNFTKEKLKAAQENGTIIVSSPASDYEPPQADSTGSRYLSLIWINETKKDAPLDELYLLNLALVQEGYSHIKNITAVPEFADIFLMAENQAKEFKLNLFSGEKDPLFNYGDYDDVSLLDIKREVEASLKDPDHENIYNGAKVRIQGTVVGYASNIIYLQGFFDEEQSGVKGGEYAGINIFTGMGSLPSKYSTINNYIQICGTAEDSENFGFQITGVPRWPVGAAKNPNDSEVLFKAEELPEEYLAHVNDLLSSEVKNDSSLLFQPVSFKDNVKVSGGYTSDSGDITLYLDDLAGNKVNMNIYITFKYKDPEGFGYATHEDFIGKEFKLKYAICSFHKTNSGKVNYQLLPTMSSDFIPV